MPITVVCSKCAAFATVPDSAAGSQGKCPTCGASVQVPGGISKRCCVCKIDLANSPRTKDAAGNYYCAACAAARKKTADAVPEPVAMPAVTTTTAAPVPTSGRARKWLVVPVALAAVVGVAITVIFLFKQPLPQLARGGAIGPPRSPPRAVARAGSPGKPAAPRDIPARAGLPQRPAARAGIAAEPPAPLAKSRPRSKLITIPATDGVTGTQVSLGPLGKGQAITFQYVSGRWTAWPGAPEGSPDARVLKNDNVRRVNICEGRAGQVLHVAYIPGGTAAKPFVFRAGHAMREVYLNMPDNKPWNNLGSATYRVTWGAALKPSSHLGPGSPISLPFTVAPPKGTAAAKGISELGGGVQSGGPAPHRSPPDSMAIRSHTPAPATAGDLLGRPAAKQPLLLPFTSAAPKRTAAGVAIDPDHKKLQDFRTWQLRRLAQRRHLERMQLQRYHLGGAGRKALAGRVRMLTERIRRLRGAGDPQILDTMLRDYALIRAVEHIYRVRALAKLAAAQRYEAAGNQNLAGWQANAAGIDFKQVKALMPRCRLFQAQIGELTPAAVARAARLMMARKNYALVRPYLKEFAQ